MRPFKIYTTKLCFYNHLHFQSSTGLNRIINFINYFDWRNLITNLESLLLSLNSYVINIRQYLSDLASLVFMKFTFFHLLSFLDHVGIFLKHRFIKTGTNAQIVKRIVLLSCRQPSQYPTIAWSWWPIKIANKHLLSTNFLRCLLVAYVIFPLPQWERCRFRWQTQERWWTSISCY